MGPMKFAYQRGGQPILNWRHGPPNQTRAADTVALGSVLDEPTLGVPLPRPGAPEPLNGCGCHGGGVGDVTIDLTSTSFIAGLAAGWLLLKILGNRSTTP